MRTSLLLLCLLALPARAATLSTTTCTSTVRTGCVILDLSTLNQSPSTVGVQLSGTWVGTVQFEGSLNGTAYVPVKADPSGSGSWVSEATGNGIWGADVAALKFFRVRASALSSGTITVDLVPTPARRMVDLVRAVGSTFGEVAIAGTVTSEPSPNFLAALNPTRTFPEAPPAPTLTATVTTLDDPTITGRTELTVRSLANGNLRVWCCRGASCTPTSTAAYILIAGDAFRFEGIRDSDTIRCRAATDPVQINFVEVAE